MNEEDAFVMKRTESETDWKSGQDYIFTHEKRFRVYNNNQEKLEILKN